MSTKYIGFGSTLDLQTVASPVTWVAVAGIRNLGGLSLSKDAVDSTDTKSTGRYREFISGLRDGGEVTMEVAYDPSDATHKNAANGLLYELHTTTATSKWRLNLLSSPTKTWEFSALITAIEMGIPMDDLITLAVTLKVSGQPTTLP